MLDDRRREAMPSVGELIHAGSLPYGLAPRTPFPYKGCGKLEGRAALITGADSGIGRAVAIAFAREGAGIPISYLNDHDDAKGTARRVEQAGKKAVMMAGDVADPAHCRGSSNAR
jgi:hypothetical protein